MSSRKRFLRTESSRCTVLEEDTDLTSTKRILHVHALSCLEKLRSSRQKKLRSRRSRGP